MNDKSRLAIIETELKNLSTSLENHCNDQRDDFDNLFKRINALDRIYAGKWVEKVSIGVLAALLAGMALLGLQ